MLKKLFIYHVINSLLVTGALVTISDRHGLHISAHWTAEFEVGVTVHDPVSRSNDIQQQLNDKICLNRYCNIAECVLAFLENIQYHKQNYCTEINST